MLLDKSVSSAYFLFGGCTAIATTVSFCYMIETKGKSFPEIERASQTQRSAVSTDVPMVRMPHAGHEIKAA